MAICERHPTVMISAVGDCYLCRIEREMAAFMPRDPRYRYFSRDGWRFCWTTEKMGDGKYAAFIYRAVGPGSRSGKSDTYKLVKELHFVKRSTAKARALKWYEAGVAS